MTPDDRAREFNALFDALPGKNIDKIRQVCAILHLKENTIRLYRMRTPSRIIPARSLKILQEALQGKI